MTVNRQGALVAVILVLGLIAAGVYFAARPPSSDSLLKQAEQARQQRDLDGVIERVEELLRRDPGMPEPLKLAGRSAIEAGRYDLAVEYLARLPSDQEPERISGMLGGSDHMDQLRSLSKIETVLRDSLASDPHHVFANDHLAFVLGVCGRRWEARLHLLDLVRHGKFSKRHLVLLGEFEDHIPLPYLLDACHEAVPDDPLPLLGMASGAEDSGDSDRALQLLREVVRARPLLAEAQARLGKLLAEVGTEREFLAWHAALSADLDRHPGIWVARAGFARRRGERRVAVRCLWEAVRRAPNFRGANYQLGRLLEVLDHEDQARLFLDRAARLEAYERTIRLVETRLHVEEGWEEETWLLGTASRQVIELGRLWEGLAWALVALQYVDDLNWARAAIEQIEPKLVRSRDLSQTVPEANPAVQVDLSSYPFPAWPSPDPVSDPGPSSPDPAVAGGVRLLDIAAAAGLDFAYFNSPDHATEGARMFEFTGGSVAVLDYDLDGWPDLYFSQGCRWPPGDADSPEYRDRLYRNTGDGRFADVTDEAGLGDGRFSQGAAVGDLDNDGWPDLYVANIGANRLYRNNGDGSFSDISDSFGTLTGDWTTSCLIADLDGDGIPDLYDVNYLDGPGIFTTICNTAGVPVGCSPNEFDGLQDRLWLATGRGYRDVTESSGVAVADGKGLGIVAADFDRSGRLGLFIANDSVANFLFLPSSAGDGKLFVQDGLRHGLAFDREGRPQACMGIAVADADFDGRIDLFVTNFYNEANVFYRQRSTGQFFDATKAAGLSQTSWNLVGFGTQFIDGELDGNPDLVLVNGHVDDFTKLGQPWRMKAQYFRNAGDARFVELTDLGPYFGQELLGRAMAKLDVDRDGREDLAISHLESPVALLVNRTARVGHSLTIRLVATTTARDAIGTTVTLRVGDWTRSAQLTAGDGYMASNQRQLVFGLGDRDEIGELTVEWPSGAEATYRNVAAGVELVIVEGAATPIRLP